MKKVEKNAFDKKFLLKLLRRGGSYCLRGSTLIWNNPPYLKFKLRHNTKRFKVECSLIKFSIISRSMGMGQSLL